jgi:hypothetical protein
MGGDAGIVCIGGVIRAGLARYCNDTRSARNNVMFTPKSGRKNVCGIKVLPGKTILRGEELFVTYGKGYWK